jgi:hypothetical protein
LEIHCVIFIEVHNEYSMADHINNNQRQEPRCSRCRQYNLFGIGHNRTNQQCPGRLIEAAAQAQPPLANVLDDVNLVLPDNAQQDLPDILADNLLHEMQHLNVGANQLVLLIDMPFEHNYFI